MLGEGAGQTCVAELLMKDFGWYVGPGLAFTLELRLVKASTKRKDHTAGFNATLCAGPVGFT